ncbi:hypothetical protein FHG87_009688 [Trinorchestia longiramus]|nr:hypothetical protein FHG87_009688 [Trinorchestia longiramus]
MAAHHLFCIISIITITGSTLMGAAPIPRLSPRLTPPVPQGESPQNPQNSEKTNSWFSSPSYSPSAPSYSPSSQNYSLYSPSYTRSSPSYSPASPSKFPSSPSYSPSSPRYSPSSFSFSLSSPSYSPSSPSYLPAQMMYHASPAHTLPNVSPRKNLGAVFPSNRTLIPNEKQFPFDYIATNLQLLPQHASHQLPQQLNTQGTNSPIFYRETLPSLLPQPPRLSSPFSHNYRPAQQPSHPSLPSVTRRTLRVQDGDSGASSLSKFVESMLDLYPGLGASKNLLGTIVEHLLMPALQYAHAFIRSFPMDAFYSILNHKYIDLGRIWASSQTNLGFLARIAAAFQMPLDHILEVESFFYNATSRLPGALEAATSHVRRFLEEFKEVVPDPKTGKSFFFYTLKQLLFYGS